MQKRKLSKNEQGIIGIGYDENSPITEDDFICNINKIDNIMDEWYYVAEKKVEISKKLQGDLPNDEKEKNTNCYYCDVGNLYIHYEPNSLF